MTKKLKVIVLPQNTNNPVLPAIFQSSNGMINIYTESRVKTLGEYYYMYLVDESAPIQEGDWYIEEGKVKKQ